MDSATPEIYTYIHTLSLPDARPILRGASSFRPERRNCPSAPSARSEVRRGSPPASHRKNPLSTRRTSARAFPVRVSPPPLRGQARVSDRTSTMPMPGLSRHLMSPTIHALNRPVARSARHTSELQDFTARSVVLLLLSFITFS